MNVQIANVITDISGVTSMAILNAILEGERDRYKLAALADPHVQASKKEIAKSWRGTGDRSCCLSCANRCRPIWPIRSASRNAMKAAQLRTMEDQAEPGSKPQTPK